MNESMFKVKTNQDAVACSGRIMDIINALNFPGSQAELVIHIKELARDLITYLATMDAKCCEKNTGKCIQLQKQEETQDVPEATQA